MSQTGNERKSSTSSQKKGPPTAAALLLFWCSATFCASIFASRWWHFSNIIGLIEADAVAPSAEKKFARLYSFSKTVPYFGGCSPGVGPAMQMRSTCRLALRNTPRRFADCTKPIADLVRY
jgi:hypothetical protein